MTLEGMTVPPALLLMATLIERTQNLASPGHMAEFGTYKGRVAALMGMAARKEDTLHLIDTADYLEQEKFQEKELQYHFYKQKSEDWCSQHVEGKRFVFTHHDASHYFENVRSEITAIAPNMDELGVMVLDDFTDAYNQVRAAYFYSRYVEKLAFELLLIGFGKAVLVCSEKFDMWEQFVLADLQSKLGDKKLQTTLYRTDINSHSRALSIQQKRNPEEPDRYGLNIWGQRFYTDSSSIL